MTAPDWLSVEGLTVRFPAAGGRVVRAVEDVAFGVPHGRIVGLVGESGSGKTSIGRAILRLTPATGRVMAGGEDLLALSDRAFRPWRRRMQIVFQDPYASLDPRMTVAEILGEALRAGGVAPRARAARAAALLGMVGLPVDALRRHPHAFSGGQRQRIGVARALAVEPEFLVADEPVSALDVSIQAQVLNLIQDLQARLRLSLLFIAHDIAVVEHLCDEVVVLYLGRVMERGPARAVIADPRHPYTRALISAAPEPDPGAARRRIILKGDIPSPLAPPSGCVFRTRCPWAAPLCAEQPPRETARPDGGSVACHFHAAIDGTPP